MPAGGRLSFCLGEREPQILPILGFQLIEQELAEEGLPP
jgi:hypothetical protein